MVKIIWTEKAYHDLDHIGNYIITEGFPSYASKALNYLIESTSILKQFPLAGRMVPEFGRSDIRELIRMRYRIVYRVVNPFRVDILTIYHSSRLMPDLSDL